MKVYKKNELSLFIKPFGIRGKLYLGCSVMVFFDLANPDALLTEQELWKTVPDQLGAVPILDTGMPKPRGEVLLAGSCCAPRGRTVPAATAGLRVGPVAKALHGVGNRYWERGGTGLSVITPPEPFASVPLAWANAFGGPGFEQNPAGKGIEPVKRSDGTERVPLPNLEHPAWLIGSPADRPEPAGFGPLDMLHPVRQRKTGTYNQRWLEERWPWFPDDMNYEYFNAAPADQYLDGFFTGEESIEIVGMHPDFPVLRSRLPRVRVHCFVTRQKDLKSKAEADWLFEEGPPRIDTVWLFPTISRGVVIHRGTTEILDEEYDDVHRIFLVWEAADQPGLDLAGYRDAQAKLIDRSVPVDLAPLQAAQAKIARTLRKAKRLPKDIEEFKKGMLGKSPVMPRTPEDMIFLADELIAKGHAVLNQLEPIAKDMHAKFGHLVAINLNQFDVWRQRLAKMGAEVKTAAAEAGKAQQEMQQLQQELGRKLQTGVPAQQLAKAGIDPEEVLATPKINPWHDRGFPLVVEWRRNLERDGLARAELARLGFESQTVSRSWLGLVREPRLERPADWGLEDPPEPFAVPAGLSLPRFAEAVLDRVSVRPGLSPDWPGDVGEWVLPGSNPEPLFLPAPPAVEPPVAVRLADELQALLVEQEAGDAVGVVALRGPDEPPGQDAAKAVKDAPVFLVVVPAAMSADEWTGWAKVYPNARRLDLPEGRTVFEARATGTDLRRWLLAALPPELARPHRLEIPLPEPGKPPGGSPLAGISLPIPDIKALVDKLMTEVRAHFQPTVDAMNAGQKELIAKAGAVLAKAGLDPALAQPAVGKEPPTFAEGGAQMSQKLLAQRDRLQSMGALSLEDERKLTRAAGQASQMGQQAEAMYQDGVAKIASGTKQLEEAMAKVKAGELPAEAKTRFLEAGLDPDRIKKRSREDVIAMHGRGESLAGAILSGVDLSGLDLRGIDLTGCQCAKTRFGGSDLAGARLVKVQGAEADFTKTSLRQACLDFSIFNKARLAGADLSEATLKQVTLNKADLCGADCTGASLEMVCLQQGQLRQARLAGLSAYLCVIEGDATECDFTGARIRKSVLRKMVLDRADFRGAALNSTLLQDVRGEAVTFAGANLDKFRVGGQTCLAGADFRNVQMLQGCLREADLTGADFGGASLRESMCEKCDLRRARLGGIMARGARLTKTDLEGADLRGINLFEGSLRKSRLVGADLREASLCAVDLYQAVMGETRLDGANLSFTLLYRRTELLP